MSKIRCGIMTFANLLPLTGKLGRPVESTWQRGVPAELNAQLLAGELAMSFISCVAYARHAEQLYLLPGLSIASEATVGSVGLFLPAECPGAGQEEAQAAVRALGPTPHLLLTSQSATGAVLLRIVLELFYGLQPTYEVATAPLARAGAAQGVLWIGDDALRARQEKYTYFDLGAAWREATGLPMVYGLLAVRKAFSEAHPQQTARALREWKQARPERGVVQPEVLQAAAALGIGLGEAEWRAYFTGLRFDWDDRLEAGLVLFYHLAQALGCCAIAPRLQWLPSDGVFCA